MLIYLELSRILSTWHWQAAVPNLSRWYSSVFFQRNAVALGKLQLAWLCAVWFLRAPVHTGQSIWAHIFNCSLVWAFKAVVSTQVFCCSSYIGYAVKTVLWFTDNMVAGRITIGWSTWPSPLQQYFAAHPAVTVIRSDDCISGRPDSVRSDWQSGSRRADRHQVGRSYVFAPQLQ